ncbi:MAG: YphA family membrane protein [Tuberibacillus sp.]
MTSAIFYEFLWGLWIFAAFIMKKDVQRTWFMFGLLIFIFLAGHSIHLFVVEINTAWIALLLSAYTLYIKQPLFRVLKLVLSNLTITICYVLIRIYWLMDPAIFLVLDRWVFSLCLAGLVMAIVKTLKMRLSTAVISVCQGDWLHTLLFYPYDNVIGDVDCFNSLAVTLMMILGWTIVKILSQKIQAAVTKQIHHRL